MQGNPRAQLIRSGNWFPLLTSRRNGLLCGLLRFLAGRATELPVGGAVAGSPRRTLPNVLALFGGAVPLRPWAVINATVGVHPDLHFAGFCLPLFGCRSGAVASKAQSASEQRRLQRVMHVSRIAHNGRRRHAE